MVSSFDVIVGLAQGWGERQELEPVYGLVRKKYVLVLGSYICAGYVGMSKD